jgi:hypothetical protein
MESLPSKKKDPKKKGGARIEKEKEVKSQLKSSVF